VCRSNLWRKGSVYTEVGGSTREVKSAPSSPPCSPSIDGSQNGLPPLRYLGLPPTQPLRLALVDPTDKILKGVEARSVVPAV
jgi:hypothetical protein